MEEEINCSMSIDESHNKINIVDLSSEDIELDYSSDIDFTNLVSILTEKIDESKKIILTFEDEVNDEKLQLVVDTIKDIFDLYNQSIENEEALAVNTDEAPS